MISFREIGQKGVMYPHDDALIIYLIITNCTIKWVLVDSGSSVDILFWDVFAKMDIDLAEALLNTT